MGKTIHDIEDTDPLSFIFKGVGGTGKSIAMASYGFYGPTLHLDMDKKLRSIKTFYLPRIGNREFKYEQESYKYNYPALITRLDSLLSLKVGTFPYSFVFLDSLTSLARNLIRLMIRGRGGTHRDKDGKQGAGTAYKVLGKIESDSTGIIKNKFSGIPIPEIEDYLGESNGIIDVLDYLQALREKHGCHIGLIAHIVRTENHGIDGSIISTEIQLLTAGRKIAAEIPTTWEEQYLFTQKGQIDTKLPPKYLCRTVGVSDMLAATCLPLPAEIDWTNKIFFDEWHAQLKSGMSSFGNKDGRSSEQSRNTATTA
jgi:hypothetical protein